MTSRIHGRIRRFRRTLCRELDFHGLAHCGWHFMFDPDWTSVYFAACCLKTGQILFSYVHVRDDPWSEVYDTILHEIAHLKSGVCGHGPRWQATARALGAKRAGFKWR
jgi:hypothetical protein